MYALHYIGDKYEGFLGNFVLTNFDIEFTESVCDAHFFTSEKSAKAFSDFLFDLSVDFQFQVMQFARVK